MTFSRCVILGTILLLALLPLEYVNAARGRGGGHHSYPHHSGGLSGGGHHGYPSSGGLSGHGSSGSNHGYPSSGGLSGNSRPGHTYPQSGSSSSGGHGYPASPGLSGNSHGYPGGKGTSGNTHITNNYHYSPPKQISYTPVHGAPVSYPVYHGTPPTYVYQYKDSGSKYGTLLAGLALLNLGTLAGTAYAIHNSNSGHSSSSGGYKAQPGEVCKFGVKKDNGDYEETRIDCQLISSFIFQAEQEKAQNGGTNTTVVTTTVTNVTMVNTTNGVAEPASTTEPPVGNVIYSMLPNGTLVPLNGTVNNVTANATVPDTPAANGVESSVMVTTTTTNTTVTNALDVKGKPVEVTPGMQCYLIRHSPVTNMKKTVPCGLLQSYADQSLKKSSAARNVPMFTILAVVLAKLLV